jgi:hypothetical protein
MLTLDEVIALMEDERRCDVPMYKDDALHYLKKYRDNYEARNDQIERYQKAAKECEEILTDYVALKQYWAEQQANPALSWDELAQMVANGKPVWIEMNHFGVHWYFIDMVTEDIAIFIGIYKENVQLYRSEYGKTWNAYRKEHHE